MVASYGEGFGIARWHDAAAVIEAARHMGLADITRWTTPETVQQFLGSDQWIALVAVESDPPEDLRTPHILGCIIGGLEEEGRVWIELLAVSPSHRRRGIGRALITHLEGLVREMGYRALFVDLDDTNPDAYEFYRAVGFEDAGVIREYYYDATDAIVMSKRLL